MPATPSQAISGPVNISFENIPFINRQFLVAFKNVLPVNEQFFATVQKMFPNNDVLINTVRVGLEMQAALLSNFAQKTIESAEKLVDLNMTAAKASLNESSVLARQLLATSDPQEGLSLVAALPQPTATKAVAYGRHLANIACTAQTEMARATEEQITETGRRLSAVLDEASKNVPAGSENAMGMMKSTITNTVAVYEQLAKTTKQAAEAIETNMHAAVDRVAQTAEQATKAANQARSK
jgi:phasin family protein